MHASKSGSGRYYGWNGSGKPDFRDLRFSVERGVNIPAFLDLSSPKLPPPYEPPLDQGAQGSCGPNTVTECICLVAESDENAPLLLPSRQFIYYATRALMGTINQDSGVDNRTMMKALAQFGWCDDSLCPYSDNPNLLKVKPNEQAYAQAATRKILEYRSVPQSAQQMKGCLASRFPIIFGFSVFASFEGSGPAHTGIIPLPTVFDNGPIGGHDVQLVGFNSSGHDMPGVLPGNKWPTGYWKFRNHWYQGSIPWGDAGFGYLPDQYVLDASLSGDFWAITKSGLTPQPIPVPIPPQPVPQGLSLTIPAGFGLPATITVQPRVNSGRRSRRRGN